jgi:uncharacterized membrane protein YqjE
MSDPAKRAAGQVSEYGYDTRERSAGEIVKDILASAQDIIRSEVRLAKAEIREETQKAIAAGILLGAGAVVALYALGFLLSAGTYALALILPMWAAVLIVGGVLAIAAGAMVSVGLARWKLVHTTPEKTINDVKENVEWLKRQTKS